MTASPVTGLWVENNRRLWKQSLRICKAERPFARCGGMLRWLGADVSQGSGSRVRVALKGVEAVFHQPHPEKEVGKPGIRSIREFLTNAGIEP